MYSAFYILHFNMNRQQQEKFELFRQYFPEFVTDNAIDIEAIAAFFCDRHSSSCGLSLHEKQAAQQLVEQPVDARLHTKVSQSIAPQAALHQLIEGENLDVLRLLTTKYSGRVKMIYIDPPYNTGNASLMYHDKRGQTNWLAMMYPRLLLARQLLSANGLIFISIDHNEMHRLKLLADEVFGPKNYAGEIVWHNRTTPNDAGLNFAIDHEYILLYAKDKAQCRLAGIPKDLSKYRNPDNDPNGPWTPDNPSAASGNESMRFPIENPITGEIYYPPPGRYWAFSHKRVEEWSRSGKMVFPKTKGRRFVLKKYKHELRSTRKPFSSVVSGILTSHGTKELKQLFAHGAPMKYPKPVALVRQLIEQTTTDNDIVLDFFAGSATTGQAVIQANIADAARRRFIGVQIAEKVPKNSVAEKNGFATIFEIAAERLRRYIAHQKQQQPATDNENLALHVLSLEGVEPDTQKPTNK